MSKRKSFQGKNRNTQRRNQRTQKKRIHSLLQKGIIPPNISRSFLLHELKYELLQPEVDILFDRIEDELFDYIVGSPLPSKYNELSPFQEFINGRNLEKELSWLLRFILDYSSEINRFLQLEAQYENLLLNGDYKQALAKVIQTETEICVSQWSINQKLFIAELDKGFKANKDVLSSILSDGTSILITFLTNYTSIRIEKNISASQYAAIVDQYIDALGHSDLNPYVFFKLDFFRNVNYNDFTDVLVYDGTLSIIDRYKAFVQVLQIFICKNSGGIGEKIVKSTVLPALKVIHDIDLHLLQQLFDAPANTPDINFHKLVDEYTQGDYYNCHILARFYIQENSRCFPSILIYCKCLCNIKKDHQYFENDNSLLNSIISLVLILLKKEEEFSVQAYTDLYKIAHFLGNHPLAIGIFEFLTDELPYRVPEINGIDISKLALLNSKANNPLLLGYLRNRKIKQRTEIQEWLKPGATSLLLQTIEENSFKLLDIYRTIHCET